MKMRSLLLKCYWNSDCRTLSQAWSPFKYKALCHCTGSGLWSPPCLEVQAAFYKVLCCWCFRDHSSVIEALTTGACYFPGEQWVQRSLACRNSAWSPNTQGGTLHTLYILFCSGHTTLLNLSFLGIEVFDVKFHTQSHGSQIHELCSAQHVWLPS